MSGAFVWEAGFLDGGASSVLAWPTLSAGALYGRRIPLAALRLDEARVVDLGEEPALQPTLRTNGLHVSGYSVGWFGLRRLQRVLVFLTDRSRVLYLPTTEGYALMLSAERGRPCCSPSFDSGRASAPPQPNLNHRPAPPPAPPLRGGRTWLFDFPAGSKYRSG